MCPLAAAIELEGSAFQMGMLIRGSIFGLCIHSKAVFSESWLQYCDAHNCILLLFLISSALGTVFTAHVNHSPEDHLYREVGASLG